LITGPFRPYSIDEVAKLCISRDLPTGYLLTWADVSRFAVDRCGASAPTARAQLRRFAFNRASFPSRESEYQPAGPPLLRDIRGFSGQQQLGPIYSQVEIIEPLADHIRSHERHNTPQLRRFALIGPVSRPVDTRFPAANVSLPTRHAMIFAPFPPLVLRCSSAAPAVGAVFQGFRRRGPSRDGT